MPDKIRCPWANADPLSREYHDLKWGVPCHDDRELFKMLILEGKQAGLAWITILRKMAGILRAFDDLDPAIVAGYDELKVAELLQNPEIIRNRLKIGAAIGNARAYLNLREKGTTLDEFLWKYVDGAPVVNHWRSMGEIPASTPLSDAISRDLKALGFKFVGSTIVYSWIQAVGAVDDHLESCQFKRKFLSAKTTKKAKKP
ncbi:MAG: DNA-3-methyladenine glycosylase I [Deltaproteobacteria bacterium]|jgi:DNA-3-methyladenine glycosylase I|nr:DNA-3-methyladenine glycosylase I [Deltaproteobacteria bacterium]